MPLIAVTASNAQEAEPYIASITSRGADARLVTPENFADLAETMEGVSGLMLCGGYDVHPKLYGQDVDPAAHVHSWPERDEMELAILRDALARDMPVLCICRGMQLMNVAFGGSLIQDLPGHRPSTDAQHDEPQKPLMHPVYVSPGSKLGAIIGAGAIYRTNSHHHQGVREPQKAPALLASAYHTEDGAIEGLESPAHGWVIGVQCHPEREDEVPRNFLRLFDGLIDWASRFEGLVPR